MTVTHPVRSRHPLIAVLLSAPLAAMGATAMAQPGPLPSWKEGPARHAIVDFVARVTREGGPDFVPTAHRIAVFDNDGTLWSEQPLYFQLAFALDRIRALAPGHPEWRTQQPFKGLIERDMRAVIASGKNGLAQIMALTHAGMTTEEFRQIAEDWILTAKHPHLERVYTDLIYQPMLELLAYLRASGFKTYIVSGGGIEFMRTFAERVYGIPPEQVIGSSGVVRFEMGKDGSPKLVKLPEVHFIDDGPGKPVGIHQAIGRRPILAFGNSDGDLQMLQWTLAGDGPRLAALVHHTDAEREWAYDRNSHVGRLDKALDEARTRGWLIVDMKQAWSVVYPFQGQPAAER
jgi:phosphoglycolate phosphatase-like HAD superfamily hydrolase